MNRIETMKTKLKVISLFLIILFISVSSVYADDTAQIGDNITETGTNNINENIDETVTDNPNVKSEGFYDLQQQIWKSSAGDTIELDSNYVDDGKRDGITIDRTITLEGNGHTLDGNGKAIFYIKGIPNVTIKNTIFINGEKNCGGGIFADSGSNYLTIENCTFINNKATTGNIGGAIYIKASQGCTITDSKFENNYAPSSGGAIRIEGDSNTISNSMFSGNTAESSLGGAINALGHDNKIIDNTFIRNLAGRDGGAIDIEGSKVAEMGTGNIISNNVFMSNRVTGSNEGSKGGAISITGRNCEITNNNFTNNHADTLGGAIRWNGASSNSGKINGNIFENHDAESGGAIYFAGSGIIISENTFNENKATVGAGGSINIKGNISTISNNKITKSSTKTSGGAIYIDGESNKITDNNISDSTAESSSGAAYILGNSFKVEGNIITGTNAGTLAGAMQIKGDSGTISKNKFINNAAAKSGGAAYIEGKDLTLSYNEFIGNKAGSSDVGGAFRLIGDNAIISSNKFEKNTANSGYAFYGTGDHANITNNNFVDGNANDATLRMVGTYTTYSKNSFNGSIVEITPDLVKTVLTVPAKTFVVTSTAKTVTATLKDVDGKAISGKTIQFIVNGKTYTGKTNAKGVATAKVTLKTVKTFTMTVKFVKDSTFDSATKTAKVKITKEKTKLTAPTKTFKKTAKTKKVTVTLKSASGKLLASKKITLKVNGKIYKATTTKKGKATVNVKLTKKKTFTYTVKFAGDKQYYAVSKTGKIVIK